MKTLLFLAWVASDSVAGSFTCEDLKFSRGHLTVHASNFFNANTSRTPDGGPYQKKIVVRKPNGVIEVESRKEIKKVYLKDHPDADATGFVDLPNINEDNEAQAVSDAAKAIEMMAKVGVCGMKILTNRNTSLVKYDGKGFPSQDTFTFDEAGKLVSWTSFPQDGEVHTVRF